MQSAPEQLATAQSQRIQAGINGNIELEEHYRELEIQLVESMAENKGEL